MKGSKWYFGFFVFFLFLFLGLIFVSRSFFPYVNSAYLKKTNYVYQKTQEDELVSRLTEVLTPLLGKHSFRVSVAMQLVGQTQEIRALDRSSQPMTETVSERVSENKAFLKEKVQERRPDFNELYQDIRQMDDSFEGLVIPLSASEMTDDLPGFPVLPSAAVTTVSSQNVPALDSQETYGKEHSTTREGVFFDETHERTLIPQTQLKKLSIGIVIDEDQFKLLNLSEDKIREVVQSVSGVDLSRGDDISVSYLPFLEKSFSLDRIYLEHQAFFDSITSFLYRARFWILSFFLFMVLGTIVLYGSFKVRSFLQEKRLKEEELQLLADEADFERERLHRLEVHQKKDALAKFVQQCPEEFADLLLNWIELSEKGGKFNANA